MTRRILTTLALLALAAVVSSVGLLHAQDPAERPPYRIHLHTGWNLISFPGDPVDPTLENVIGDAQVDMVLAYRDARWSAAVRKSDGIWRTTSGFTMSGGRGYWVHATAGDVVEAALSPDTPRPSSEGCRWQLMGIWDAEQRAAGTRINADDHFASIRWRAAYTYRPSANLWEKLVAGSNETVETGAGYWVWVASGHAHTPDSVHYFCGPG